MDERPEVDLVFQALASQTRRLILDLVKRQPGCSVNDVCGHFEISRIGVMKHMGILVDAQLLISRKRGRTRELYFNAAPIQLIYDRWTDEYSAFWTTQALDLKYKVEGRKKNPARSKPRPGTGKKKRQRTTKKPRKQSGTGQ